MVRQENQVVSIDQVLAAFVKGYQFPEGVSLVSCDHLLDPVKGKFILTLILDDNTPPQVEMPVADPSL